MLLYYVDYGDSGGNDGVKKKRFLKYEECCTGM